MGFIVQDLLDYAQIKSEKFRKNVAFFNVIDCVENVMSIQRAKADDQGIEFYATFTNIYKKVDA